MVKPHPNLVIHLMKELPPGASFPGERPAPARRADPLDEAPARGFRIAIPAKDSSAHPH
jgi:hypothetical protein